MKQLYISCVRPIFEYASLAWYHKLTGQWKDEIQKGQNTELRKILGPFRSAPIKTMQCDTKILPVNIRMKETRDWFAIRAIHVVGPRNPGWKLPNSSKLAKGDLENLFARVKQINGVDDDKYWRKHPSWKQSNYLRNMKSDKAFFKSWKEICMLLRVMNGNQIMTHQVKSVTTTLSLRGNCMAESTLIHWNLSWVACPVIPLESRFNFV